MNSFYLDASALAKRYAPEIGSAVLNHLFRTAARDRFLLLNIGIAEVISLLVRKRNSGRLSSADFSAAVLEVDRELITAAPVRKIVVGNLLLFSALSLIEKHGINATDGVILRSALDIGAKLRLLGDDLVLLSCDQRLNKAARAEGLIVFDPESDSQADLDRLLPP